MCVNLLTKAFLAMMPQLVPVSKHAKHSVAGISQRLPSTSVHGLEDFLCF